LRGRARRQNATCGRPGSDWRTPGSARHSVRDARRRAEARTGGRGAAVAVHPISELGSGLPGADFGVLTCPLTKETEKLEATDSFRERNRWFESTSLQQTVRLSPGFASVRGQSPGFQPLCGPFRAAVVGRDAQRHPAHPHALPLRGGDLVADALAARDPAARSYDCPLLHVASTSRMPPSVWGAFHRATISTSSPRLRP